MICMGYRSICLQIGGFLLLHGLRGAAAAPPAGIRGFRYCLSIGINAL